MLAAADPLTTILQLIGIVFAILLAAAGSYYIVQARKGTADDNEAVKTATLMTGQITALQSARQLDRAEIDHTKELLKEKDRQLETMSSDMERLKDLVTSRDLITELTIELRSFEDLSVRCFDHLGVPAEKLKIDRKLDTAGNSPGRTPFKQ